MIQQAFISSYRAAARSRVAWFVAGGAAVAVNQPLIRFLVPQQEQKFQSALQKLDIAERRYQALTIQHEQERTALLEEKQLLEARRDVSLAKLQRLGDGSQPEAIALAAAEVAQAELAVQRALQNYQRLQVLVQTGTRLALDLLSPSQALQRAQQSLDIAETKYLKLQQDRQEIAIAQEQLVLQRNLQELGDPNIGSDGSGWYQRRHALDQRHAASEQQQKARVSRTRSELRLDLVYQPEAYSRCIGCG